MRTLFWLSAGIVGYVYIGYPMLMALWARVGRRPVAAAPGSAPRPPVSIVIAARNEAPRLPRRIENLAALDYSGAQQIILVSDGSTDDTLQRLEPFGELIDVIALPPHGKAAALNAGVAHARHDIIVFADARQAFAPDALTYLTAPFADAQVGGVTGELVLGCEPGGRRSGVDRREIPEARPQSGDRRHLERRGHSASTVGDGIGLYWRYEKALRRFESAVGSTLGATGAIYALRRSLWQDLPEGTTLDDVLAPMRAVLAGKRVVFEPRAVAFDWTPPDSSTEARRKIRTLAGNLQILRLEPRLLLPVANPVWLQYVSHKLGRLVVPYALLGLMTASIALADQHPLFAIALAGQCALYLLAGYGAWLERTSTAAQPAARAIEDVYVDA